MSDFQKFAFFNMAAIDTRIVNFLTIDGISRNYRFYSARGMKFETGRFGSIVYDAAKSLFRNSHFFKMAASNDKTQLAVIDEIAYLGGPNLIQGAFRTLSTRL